MESDRPWLNWQDLFGEPAPAPVGAVSLDSPSPAQEHISQLSTKVNHESKEIETPEGRSVNLRTSPYPDVTDRSQKEVRQRIL